jgi:ABC-2 type transport system permease protein
MLGIARQEFARVLNHPVVPVVGLIVLVIAYLNGAGNVGSMEIMSSRYHIDGFFYGYGASFTSTTMVCSIMAAFLGATAIPYDRWKNSLNVLLAKPLYRKDYVLGKFLGLTGFMLLFNTLVILLTGLMIAVFFKGPESMTELAMRIPLFIICLTLACSMVAALNLLIGIVSKNILVVTAASVIFIFIDLFWYKNLFPDLMYLLFPGNLYFTVVDPLVDGSVSLYSPGDPVSLWFQLALPYLALLLIELLVPLVIGIGLFAREDNL